MGWFGNLVNKVKEVANSKVVKIIQVGLDIAGFIPVVGTVADLANAAIYTAQGDYKNAALSAMSAVPGVGDAVAATAKSAKVLKAAKAISKGGDLLNGAYATYNMGKDLLNGDVSSFAMKILGKKAMKGLSKVGAKLCGKINKNSKFTKIKNAFKIKCVDGKCFTGDILVQRI